MSLKTIRPIELICCCTECGNELEAHMTLSAKEFNEGKIEVAPCKACCRVNSGVGVVSAINMKLVQKALRKLPPGPSLAVADCFPSAAPTKKKRGRPPTKIINAPSVAISIDQSIPPPRKRGRPRKILIVDAAPIVKKKRGRPRKNPIDTPRNAENDAKRNEDNK